MGISLVPLVARHYGLSRIGSFHLMTRNGKRTYRKDGGKFTKSRRRDKKTRLFCLCFKQNRLNGIIWIMEERNKELKTMLVSFNGIL